MKQERFSRHLLIAFGLSVVLYVLGYWFIESRRVVDGPWQVRFTTNATGIVELTVMQESKRLGPMTIRLLGPSLNKETATETIRFDTPRAVPFPVPGGQCIFQDTTFLPGTVVLEFGSTRIQMIPRTLTVGTNEYPWQNDSVIRLDAAETPETRH